MGFQPFQAFSSPKAYADLTLKLLPFATNQLTLSLASGEGFNAVEASFIKTLNSAPDSAPPMTIHAHVPNIPLHVIKHPIFYPSLKAFTQWFWINPRILPKVYAYAIIRYHLNCFQSNSNPQTTPLQIY